MGSGMDSEAFHVHGSGRGYVGPESGRGYAGPDGDYSWPEHTDPSHTTLMIVTCQRCGAAIVIDAYSHNRENVELHDRWHEERGF